MARAVPAAIVALFLGVRVTPAQQAAPPLDALLARMAAYVQTFVDDFANVVAQEDYQQDFRRVGGRRRLKSDFLFVGYPGEEKLFLTFRDVLEVNGRPVRDQQERLTKLFLEPFQNAVKRAGEITRDSERQSDSRGRLMDPLQVMAFLQGPYQGNFDFEPRGMAGALGPDVREIRFVQRTEPPMRASAIEGTAWISERTGRVVKTELRVGGATAMRITTTTFGHDAGLRIDVPIEMRDSVPLRNDDEFIGRARYSRFRRFQVQTQEAIDVLVRPR